MIRLALVGRDISHSRSPDIYRSFLGDELNYKLLDYKDSSDIPPLKNIFKDNSLDGLSITSPYKTHFLKEVNIENPLVKSLGVINCIGFKKNELVATNTDLLACHEILKRFLLKKPKSEVIILGNGSMTKTLSCCLDSLSQTYKVYSRKENGALENLSFNENSQLIFINACSRGFCFKGSLHANTLFWDLNYNLDHHQKYWSEKVEYVDGMELLEKQAQFALEFWELT